MSRAACIATYISSFIVCITAHIAQAEPAPKNHQALNVLFIGNSLTSRHNLPKLIADIATSKGRTLRFITHTKSVAKLQHHTQNPTTFARIRSRKWDYVVLQEQSQLPAFSPEQIAQDMAPYVAQLVDATVQQGATPVFYMTMARKEGDPGNAFISAELVTYAGMQTRINNSYYQLAHHHNALTAPVGYSWQWARHHNPALMLYEPDGIHPNLTGAYLAACTFYTSFFTDTCLGASAPESIPQNVATYIQKISDASFAPPAQWDFRPQE